MPPKAKIVLMGGGGRVMPPLTCINKAQGHNVHHTSGRFAWCASRYGTPACGAMALWSAWHRYRLKGREWHVGGTDAARHGLVGGDGVHAMLWPQGGTAIWSENPKTLQRVPPAKGGHLKDNIIIARPRNLPQILLCPSCPSERRPDNPVAKQALPLGYRKSQNPPSAEKA